MLEYVVRPVNNNQLIIEHIIQPIHDSFGMLKNVEPFRSTIQSFICDAESSKKKIFQITMICQHYGIQRRRFYDVVSVLEKTGLCSKTSMDTIRWFGMNGISLKLAHLIQLYHSDDKQSLVNSLFKNTDSITINHLTESFLICFVMNGNHPIDIKRISVYLSKHNGRYKSTLCKLYQIAHILESVGIIEKSSTPGHMKISDFYYPSTFPPCETAQKTSLYPPSIESLLNHPLQ